MEFSEFFSIIHPIIGGGNSTDKSAKSLFESIMDDNSYEILDGYSSATFKAYANGSTKITKIAKAISPYIDASEFEDYIDNFGEAATIRLSESFLPHIPDITKINVGEKLADLFINGDTSIIDNAKNWKVLALMSKWNYKRINDKSVGFTGEKQKEIRSLNA